MSKDLIYSEVVPEQFPEWGLFCDFHTMRDCPDVGSKLDVPYLIENLQSCGIDFLTVPARCNQGFAYYPTKIGTPHPGMVKRDIFGEIVSGCRNAGIFISGYVNVDISMEEYSQNPDWRVVPKEGESLPPLMCVNSGYGDHLCAMTEEIVSKYDVTGIFFDCVYALDCDCPHCREAGLTPNESRRKILSRLSSVVKKYRPSAMIFFNSMPAEEQIGYSNYLELECLPNGGWSYEMLPLLSRYLRNFGRPVFGMSGRFHRSWGDFGGLRSVDSLTYDCAFALANGLQVTVGTHLHPTMELNPAVVGLIREVYANLRQHWPYCRHARAKTEIVLVVPGKNLKENLPENMETAYGACRMLQELGMQFDITTEEMKLSPGCRLVILADNVRLEPGQISRLREFIASGGSVIATGGSGLTPDGKAFAVPELGAESRQIMPDMGHFIRAGVEGFPAMPVALYAEAAVYTPAAGSRIMARMEAASFTLPAENSLPCIYLPPGGRDEGAVMGKNGRCIYSPVRIFSDYFHFVQYPLRALLKAAIKELLPEPLIDSGKLPSWVRVTVTEQPGRNMIHLLSFIPERRGESFDVVESAIPFTDAVVRFRTDGKVPARIFLSPDPEKQLKWTTDGNYICIQLPEAGGCTLIVVEWK